MLTLRISVRPVRPYRGRGDLVARGGSEFASMRTTEPGSESAYPAALETRFLAGVVNDKDLRLAATGGNGENPGTGVGARTGTQLPRPSCMHGRAARKLEERGRGLPLGNRCPASHRQSDGFRNCWSAPGRSLVDFPLFGTCRPPPAGGVDEDLHEGPLVRTKRSRNGVAERQKVCLQPGVSPTRARAPATEPCEVCRQEFNSTRARQSRFGIGTEKRSSLMAVSFRTKSSP